MLRRLSVAAALCALTAVMPAHALGLGDIKVRSGLNQRFSAVIPFTSLTPEEAANVRARVADNQDFARAGLDRSGYLSSIRVEAITDGPNPRVELSSGEIAREPLLTLLIEVRKPGGTRMLREYTVLLDPAVTAGGETASARRGGDTDFFQTPEEARGDVPPRRAAGAPASSQGASFGEDGLYGPVREGDTLWMIAQAVKPAGVSLDQAMLALFEANPGAFRGGDIDHLRAGARLQVPSADAMQKLGNAASRARVLELSSEIGTGPAESSTLSSSSFPPPAPPAKPAAPPEVVEAPPAVVAPAAPATTAAEAAPTPETAAAPSGTTSAGDVESASGDVDAEGKVNVETPPAAPATATGPATDAAATTQAPPAAEPAPEAQGVDIVGWLTKLLPVFIALIVLLIAFVAWRAVRERKAQRDYERAARETTRIPAPRMGATGSFPAKSAHSARDELEELGRQIDDDATRVAVPAADDDEDRTRMVTTSKILAYTGPTSLASDRPMDEAEMAVTSQFQANTMEIKLGDNDPISEADFHLAYGLYDEAALLLQQASARAPNRPELRVKLAETYFAAGKATEFEQTAQTLKGEISSDEWNKIAIMGRQLVPASGLFAAGEASTSTSTSTDTVLDLTFDDDATQIVPVKVDEGLEFNLEELELPSKTDQLAAQASQSLEFDLGEFDLSGVDKPKKPTPPPPASNVIDFQEFDLGGTEVSGPGKSDLDVRLDEIEPMVIDDPLADEASSSSSDDATTSLNLARVYVEMGDAEMARSLLDQVTASGTEEQKREAEQLRERLSG